MFLHEGSVGFLTNAGNQGLVREGGNGAKSGSPNALEAAATGKLGIQSHSCPVPDLQ